VNPGEAVREALDELAGRLFGGAAGRARFEPLARAFAERVGRFAADEPWAADFVTLRLDWALLEAPADPTGAPWALRVARQEVPGVPAHLGEAALRAFASVFEVRPGRRTLALDRIGGAWGPLGGVVWPADGHGLYEIRVVADGGRLYAVRAPQPLPAAAESLVGALRRAALATLGRPSLDGLRRGRLRMAQNPRLDPVAVFVPDGTLEGPYPTVGS